ncbi:hypothetical protein [Rodentibacter caecimuris]|uniref:Uncharacterized protein n=1 Tax=Rodentibacter caecimuris TaxID=1796644 RepID=A0ABX3KZM1_9PAST|nr:hypothetical protein BKG89_02570 [Rodentibacter heylii]
MEQIKFRAMRAAGIACFISLSVIAYWIFTTSSDDIVRILTLVGNYVGGGTTYGVFILAALPPLVGFLSYHIWKWIVK